MSAELAADRLNSALEGRYRIEEELGRGGMATVYPASDLKHDRQVAIKAVERKGDEPGADARFQREVRIAATLNHPRSGGHLASRRTRRKRRS